MIDPKLKKDFELATKAIDAAAQITLEYYGKDYEIEMKAPNNPVTEVDLKADKIIQDILRPTFHEYGVLSEETKDDGSRFSYNRVWMIDPIDGTRAFIKALPHYVVSIALVENGMPILGLILNPVTKERFIATKNYGAYKNGVKINSSNRAQIEGSNFLADPNMFSAKSWPIPWPQLNAHTRNSIAYRMALVATGQFDAAIATTSKNDWDLAAATLILQEANGVATDHLGNEFILNRIPSKQLSLLAAGKNMHQQILPRFAHIIPRLD
jgi:myo-inositol-1(or 4)-monophosphatase